MDNRVDRMPDALDSLGDAQRRAAAAFLGTSVLCLVGAGVWLYWPFLEYECRRLEPWKIAAIFAGDLLALAWCVGFLVTHLFAARPQYHPIRPSTTRGWVLMVLALSGLLVDLVVTLYLMGAEKHEYLASTRTEAEVLRVRRAEKEARTRYRLLVRFEDSRRRTYVLELETWESRGTGWLHGTSSELIWQMNGGRPFRTPIRYDPSWPQRAWLEGVGPHDDNISWFSIAVLAFQGIFGILAFAAVARSVHVYARMGRLPWWHDAYKLIPVSIEAGLMLLDGPIVRSWSWTTLINSGFGT